MMSCCICVESLQEGDTCNPITRVTERTKETAKSRSNSKPSSEMGRSENHNLQAHVKCCMLFDSSWFNFEQDTLKQVQVSCKRKVVGSCKNCPICGKALGELSLDNYIRKCAERYFYDERETARNFST